MNSVSIDSDATSLKHKVFAYVCYSDAADHVAAQVKKRHRALSGRSASRRSAGTTEMSLEEIIAITSQAYIRNPPANHLIASKKTPLRLGSPRQDGPAMVAWLLEALTLEERQVVLLLRFPGATTDSVAELLSLEESEVYYLSNVAKDKIKKRKQDTTWAESKPDAELLEVLGYDEDGEKKVPDEKKFQKIYEAYWSTAINKLAYYILADRLGASNIEDTVRESAYKYVEAKTFDVTNAWKGHAEELWPGFQQLTFDACEEEIITFSKANEKNYEPGDVWAMCINEELSVDERQCLLLSTFYHKRDPDGITAICIALRKKRQSTVKKHIRNAFEKIIKHSHLMYGDIEI